METRGIGSMSRPIYVIGHKNSDLDSVASAYAYARLLQLQGEEQAIPARQGVLKPEVRFAQALLTADFKEFTVGDTRFAIGTVETPNPAAIEKRREELLSTMQLLVKERGYSSLLFMIVDIITMRGHVLVWGGEHAVAEVLRTSLEPDGHTIIVDGLVSRKKQLVPLLARIQASLAGKI